jgi:hypothetical protein
LGAGKGHLCKNLAGRRFAMTIAAGYPEPRKWRSNTHLSSPNI